MIPPLPMSSFSTSSVTNNMMIQIPFATSTSLAKSSLNFSEEAAMAAAMVRTREQRKIVRGTVLANTKISEEGHSFASSQQIESDEERPLGDECNNNLVEQPLNTKMTMRYP